MRSASLSRCLNYRYARSIVGNALPIYRRDGQKIDYRSTERSREAAPRYLHSSENHGRSSLKRRDRVRARNYGRARGISSPLSPVGIFALTLTRLKYLIIALIERARGGRGREENEREGQSRRGAGASTHRYYLIFRCSRNTLTKMRYFRQCFSGEIDCSTLDFE